MTYKGFSLSPQVNKYLNIEIFSYGFYRKEINIILSKTSKTAYRFMKKNWVFFRKIIPKAEISVSDFKIE
jgi:hypothetical protein